MGRRTIGVNIRWTIQRDMESICQLDLLDCYPLAWGIEDWKGWLKKKNAVCMIAEHGDKLVGYMLYRFAADHITCERLGVASAFRRKGVGTALVNKLVSKLTPRRPRLQIVVDDDNLRAHLFLRALGFVGQMPRQGDECQYTFERLLHRVHCSHTGGTY